MAGIYSASFENVAVTAAQDFFEILAGASNPVLIRRFRISTNKTASEVLRATATRHTGAETSGSGGSSPTVRIISGAATTATVEANNTARVASGTAERLLADQWNIINPWEFAPIDRAEMFPIPVGDRFACSIEGNPAASINVSGWIEWEEI
jgi:hypothetical protein